MRKFDKLKGKKKLVAILEKKSVDKTGFELKGATRELLDHNIKKEKKIITGKSDFKFKKKKVKSKQKYGLIMKLMGFKEKSAPVVLDLIYMNESVTREQLVLFNNPNKSKMYFAKVVYS